jgi:hypothetical protein
MRMPQQKMEKIKAIQAHKAPWLHIQFYPREHAVLRRAGSSFCFVVVVVVIVLVGDISQFHQSQSSYISIF